MSPIVIALAALVVGLLLGFWIKRTRARYELARRTITPEVLHGLLSEDPDLLLYDLRQPLDLLADSEIIPGAKRIPPKELLENPTLIPREKEAVVYCTCPTDETSRRIMKLALDMKYLKIKFLEGGLAAWKAKGYSVLPYEQSFHLDTRN